MRRKVTFGDLGNLSLFLRTGVARRVDLIVGGMKRGQAGAWRSQVVSSKIFKLGLGYLAAGEPDASAVFWAMGLLGWSQL